MSCHLNLASVMETDFHSPGDDSHFSSLTSPLYDSSLIEDSESSLLGIIKDEFPYGSPVQCPSFWDTEPELNGSFDCSFELPQSTVSDSKEDFQKMLTDWQEHLGSLQASDNDDIEMTLSLGRQLLPQSYSSFGESLTPTIPLAEASSSSSSNAGRSILKPKEERLGQAAVYGMKVGGRDARLPIMEDSCGEDATSMLLTLAPSTSSPDLHNTSLPLQLDDDDDCIDIETVSEQNPVLEAGDLKSLLEQFEASEAVNSTTDKPGSEESTPMAVQQLHLVPNPTSLALVLSHQKIKEALPQEVIDKIRASSRKKIIPLIPAMPSKKLVRGTRMQDAAVTLNRNKLLKLVSGSAGDTVQLDHDYCTVPDNSSAVNFYHCDANEYSSSREVKLESPSAAVLQQGSPGMASVSSPRQTSLVSPQGERRLQELSTAAELPSSSKPSCWEKNAKKDSGLESGEVSDASEEVPSPRVACPSPTPNCAQPLPLKKKLNLQEYRNRREELERQKVACQQSSSSSNSSTENSECGSSPREHSPPPPPLTVEAAVVPAKPQMHSVEVQTQEAMEVEKCPSRSSRDQRSRRQHTRRSSGHGSTSSSSSSGSSYSPHWQRHPPIQQQQGVRHRRRHRSRSRSSNAVHCLRAATSDASSRSPSVSHSSSCSSPSRSRSRSRSRTTRQYSYAGSTCSQRNLKLCNDLPGWNRRSCSPRSVSSGGSDWQLTERERQRQVEERRVIYVGRLPEGTTKSDLRKRFEVFGPIIDISVHFREHGDNYGFVTFAYKVDAYDAVEHGNEDPTLPAYDLCFGGRRTFCKVRYSDLDAQAGGSRLKVARGVPISKQQESFDRLLQEAQAKLHKRGKL